MIDPVERDLHRHLTSIDRDDAIWEHAEGMRDGDPETFGAMDDDTLFEAAEADLETQAEDQAIEQYEDWSRQDYER